MAMSFSFLRSSAAMRSSAIRGEIGGADDLLLGLAVEHWSRRAELGEKAVLWWSASATSAISCGVIGLFAWS